MMNPVRRLSVGLALCALILSLVATPAGAELVARDLSSPGDGLLTLDTDTGLEWLDLTETQGSSIDAIRYNWGGLPGGRFATLEEVGQLFLSAGIVDIHGTCPENAPGVSALLELLGRTFVDPSGAQGALGICDSGQFLNEWAMKSKLRLGTQIEPLGTADVDMDVVSTHAEFEDTGVFVVRAAAVSAPEGPAIPRVNLIAYPNPFNPSTVLRFKAPGSGWTRLSLYDSRGREVRVLIDGFLPAGDHSISWDGCDRHGRGLPSGIYYARLDGPMMPGGHRVGVALVK